MKLTLTIVLTAFFASAVLGRSVKNVGVAPATSGSAGFAAGEWVGNLECQFVNENDCQISIHAAGRRIDGATHNPNEDVLMSCLSTRPSIELVIHGFAFSDIQDYSCLQETTHDYSSQWITVSPVIEPSGVFVHGESASLTCNGPLGSTLYWVLPGSSANHADAVITPSTNAQNSSSTVTFTIADSDHFAAYNCCIGLQDGQPPPSRCTTYTVMDTESLAAISSTADYSSVNFHLTAEISSNPLADPDTVSWKECPILSNMTCVPLTAVNYDVVSDPDNYNLVSHFNIIDNSQINAYKFSVGTIGDQFQLTVDFDVARLTYFPLFTKLPTQIFYNQADGTYSAILKVQIDANPSADIRWTRQITNGESTGSEDIVTGGRYAVTTESVSDTQCITTLVISPYDFTLDDAIFSVIALNNNGESCLEADTSVGPTYLTLETVSSDPGNYVFTCAFESFPTANCEINVVAPQTTSYTVTSANDPLYSLTTLTITVVPDPTNAYFLISCTAYNPYDPTITQTQSKTVIIT